MQGQSIDIPLQHIQDAFTLKHKVNLYVLRMDLNHPYISGNKLFKLKYNLEEARLQNKKTLLTFGGAYSNHIAAAAAAGKENGFETVGIIRGEKPEILNQTLQFARSQGMQLFFISREEYKNKSSAAFMERLQHQFPDAYIIPEGGANLPGIKGCKEITDHITIPFDTVCCACGTGATLTGIILSLKGAQRAAGFQVLKGKDYMRTEIENYLKQFDDGNKINWQMHEAYHFGGYAKCTPELQAFMEAFEKENNIPLEPVYTGKMMYGIYDLMNKGAFKEHETIVAIHTGGLQGRPGFYQ
jgi:1-aminocyclopropane-1-carboxylate deaminase/D-cysteine desulfhydrase-like pyridoxal-dependent ACC family enzyme